MNGMNSLRVVNAIMKCISPSLVFEARNFFPIPCVLNVSILFGLTIDSNIAACGEKSKEVVSTYSVIMLQ